MVDAELLHDGDILMRNRNVIRSGAIAVVVIFALCLLYTFVTLDRVGLPGGYELSIANSNAIAVGNADDLIVIGPHVDRYRVVGDLVVGHVSTPRWHQYPPEPTGYFVLDTRSGQVSKGLTMSGLASTLKTFGIAEQPTLLRSDAGLDRLLARLCLK